MSLETPPGVGFLISLTILIFITRPSIALGHIWTDYNVTEFAVLVGVLDTGSVNDLNTLDNIQYNISEVNGVPGMLISFNFSGIATDRETIWLVVNVLYDGRPKHDLDIDVWNFKSSDWDTIGLIPDQVDFTWINSSSYGLRIPVDYVAEGVVRGRFNHPDKGNEKDALSIDYLRLQASTPETTTPLGYGSWFSEAPERNTYSLQPSLISRLPTLLQFLLNRYTLTLNLRIIPDPTLRYLHLRILINTGNTTNIIEDELFFTGDPVNITYSPRLKFSQGILDFKPHTHTITIEAADIYGVSNTFTFTAQTPDDVAAIRSFIIIAIVAFSLLRLYPND